MSGQARALVLTASYGSGHNVAARALADAFAAAGVGAQVVDHFRTLVHPWFDRATRTLHEMVLRGTPWLWGLAYWVGDQVSSRGTVAGGANSLGVAGLARLLETARPDWVVCTHPTPAGALATLRRRGAWSGSSALVFTDYTTHRQWLQPGMDWYFVPSEAVRLGGVARGLSASRVVASGIPLRAEFALPVDRHAARAALGLRPDAPLVLLMAGAQAWAGRLEAAARVIGELGPHVQTVVVAGRHRRTAARIGRTVAADLPGMRVMGYTEDIRRLMGAADVLVTKAGGVSIAEALAAELPMVYFGSLPGQEASNARAAAAAGAGWIAPSPRELHGRLRDLLADPTILEQARHRMQALRRPDAAQAIVQRLLSVAHAPARRAS